MRDGGDVVTLPGGQLFMNVIDLAILLATIVMLLFVISRGLLRTRFLPGSGRLLIVTGIALTVFIYLLDLALNLLDPAGVPVNDPYHLNHAVPEWLGWILTRAAFSLIAVGVLVAMLQRKREEERFNTSSNIVRAARESMVESEARFRSLMETTSNAVYCYTFDPPMPIDLPLEEQIQRSHDAILTECNQVFARELDNQRPSQVVGTRMSYLDSLHDHRSHSQLMQELIDSDYRLTDYELLYKGPEGDDRAIRMSLNGIVQDGRLHRIWGSETNILDLRRTKQALERRRQFQELLASTSSRLVMTAPRDADEVIEACLQDVCRFVAANRTTLVWLNERRSMGEVTYSWNADDRAAQESVPAATFPLLTEKLLKAEVARVPDVDTMPEELAQDQQALRALGIRATVAVPLLVSGDVVGVATFSNTDERREWTDQDVLDLRVFAELFANYVMHLRAQRELDEAMVNLREASERLAAENVYLREEVHLSHGFDEIVGESPAIMRCLRQVEQVADTMTPVLVLGETGTGKELIARAIHDHSNRRERPLVKVNCAALPRDLIESELFGYEKGAFTGAGDTKRGRFDLADGSTLFLDEVGEIPIDLQAKLLRVLQEGEFERLGGDRTIKVDVRIVAATNRDLAQAVQSGEFRSDLFYRINTFPIELPSLRERAGDIQLLAEYFVKLHAQQLGRDVTAISARMMRQLRDYSWPGNVRELEGVIQRAIISSSQPVLELADPLGGPAIIERGYSRAVAPSGLDDLKDVEREHILSVLEDTGWKISGKQGAAFRLGIPPSTLRSKMKKLMIERPH